MLSLGFAGYCGSLGEYQDTELIEPQLQKKCGTLFEGLNIVNDYWGKKYHTIFLLRRLIYVSLIILLSAYPRIQYLTMLLIPILPASYPLLTM